MHILTHQVGETIMIGENNAVTILGVHGSQARLGVYAPKNVAAYGEAIFEHIAPKKMLTGRLQTTLSELPTNYFLTLAID